MIGVYRQAVVPYLVAVAHDLFGLDVAVVAGLTQAFEWACDELEPIAVMPVYVVDHSGPNGLAFCKAAFAQRIMRKLIQPDRLPCRRFVERSPGLRFPALGIVAALAVGLQSMLPLGLGALGSLTAAAHNTNSDST